MLSGQGKHLMYPDWRLWGFKPPRWIFNLFFNCVCTKILSKLCFCIYEIRKCFAQKRKNLYSIFTFCFSLLALPLDPTWWLLPSRRPGSTHFRQFLIYLLWNPSTAKSWYAYGATNPNLHPFKGLGCGSPDTLGWCEVTPCWILLVMLFAQNNVMNFSPKRHQCHQICCLNKPYFYVKNASNTQQCSYILYIFGNHTHREITP